jgi:hypothetical protein
VSYPRRPIPDFENDPTLTPQQKKRRREYYADRDAAIKKTNEWQHNHRDRVREYGRRQRQRNSEKIKAYNRAYRAEQRKSNPEYKLYAKDYQASPEGKAAMRRHLLKQKIEVINAYGGHCVCCGESRIEFLSLDHIFNDGAQHRKEISKNTGQTFYRWLRKNGFPKGRLQVLCHNCNSAKGYYGYCPHQVESAKLLGLPALMEVIRRPKRQKDEAPRALV